MHYNCANVPHSFRVVVNSGQSALCIIIIAQLEYIFMYSVLSSLASRLLTTTLSSWYSKGDEMMMNILQLKCEAESIERSMTSVIIFSLLEFNLLVSLSEFLNNSPVKLQLDEGNPTTVTEKFNSVHCTHSETFSEW